MASRTKTAKPPLQRATAAADKRTKKVEREEPKDELNLQKKVKRSSIRETKTKPTRSLQPQLTSLPTRRPTRAKKTKTVDKGTNSTLAKDRPRASLACRESRALKVTAVNIVKCKNIDKEGHKSTVNLGGRPAHTHPTTTITAIGGAKKTRIGAPRPPGHGRSSAFPNSQPPNGTTHRLNTADVEVLSSINVPDNATESSSSGNSPRPVTILSYPEITRVPDPDIGTEHNPQLCAEYTKDIYRYLLELEQRPVYAIRENFLLAQPEVKQRHRTLLVDWLVQVHKRFLLVPETLHLAINILDRSLQVGMRYYQYCMLYHFV